MLFLVCVFVAPFSEKFLFFFHMFCNFFVFCHKKEESLSALFVSVLLCFFLNKKEEEEEQSVQKTTERRRESV